MNTTAKEVTKNRLIELVSFLTEAELLEKYRRWIVSVAEWRDMTRDARGLAELLPVMSAARVHADVVEYYAAKTLIKTSRPAARQAFERLASSANPAVSARALQSQGALSFFEGDLSSAARLYHDSARVALAIDVRTFAECLKMQAVISDMTGNHKGALCLLDRLAPAVRYVSRACPVFELDYLNTRSLVLAACGDVGAAAEMARAVADSPYAVIRPEWKETPGEVLSMASRAPAAMSRRAKAQPVPGVRPASPTRDREARAPARVLPFGHREPPSPHAQTEDLIYEINLLLVQKRHLLDERKLAIIRRVLSLPRVSQSTADSVLSILAEGGGRTRAV